MTEFDKEIAGFSEEAEEVVAEVFVYRTIKYVGAFSVESRERVMKDTGYELDVDLSIMASKGQFKEMPDPGKSDLVKARGRAYRFAGPVEDDGSAYLLMLKEVG